MKEAFKSLNIGKLNKIRLPAIIGIVEEYDQQGYKLTLRQLYYQLVSRDIIPNVQSEYAKLSALLVKARMAGVIDWAIIEDRIRVPFLPYWVYGVADAIEDTMRHYRLDRQEGQAVYVELWVEKDALSGVLRPLTTHYHINLMVNRGYSSCTAMYDAYKRLYEAGAGDGKDLHILYLGDHDPSGLDMIRDIRDRLQDFGADLTVTHVAITHQQVQKYGPPPNPAKITDPRASWYINNHGNTSWEVDALPPKVLRKVVVSNIERLIDMDQFQKRLNQEEKDKKRLRSLLKR